MSNTLPVDCFNISPRYKCGSAREFKVGGDHLAEYTMTCLWDKSWEPSHKFPGDCDWVACLQPPQPPAYANLRPLWHGEPIPFGDSIHFICERGMAFEDDYFQESFKVTCDDGAGQEERRGFFTVPDYNDWPRCVRGESGVRGER